MATMYETIMNMPLFKGLSNEQVSSFLEKTHIRFTKYSDGEQILQADDRVTDVKCVISGRIVTRHILGDKETLVISEEQEGENVLGADKLFGMSTTYGCDIYAIGQVSLMEFSKDQYLNLLKTDSIYLINYLNFISYRAQLRHSLFTNYPDGDLLSNISRLISTYCTRASENITFDFLPTSFAKFLNSSTESLHNAMNKLEKEGIINCTPTGFKVINSTDLHISVH